MKALKPIPPDLATGVAYSYMPVTHINAGLAAARVLRGDPIFKVNRKPRGGGGGTGTATSFVMVYDDLPAGSVTDDGLVTWGADVRCLPMTKGETGYSPNLAVDFTLAKWPSLSALALSDGCGCSGSAGSVPTGPRLVTPLGPDGINRVKNGQTLDVSLTGLVPGEDTTLTVIAIDPDTGATSGSAIDIAVTNNGDGTGTGAATSISTLPRGLCRVMVTNGSTYHAQLILNSLDEWTGGKSNATNLVYWPDKPDAPDLHVDSDTGESTSDNITDDLTPEFTLQFSGTGIFTPTADVEALLCITNQADGAVTIVGGTLDDFNDGLEIQRAATTLAFGTYEVQLVLFYNLIDSGYDYDWWWSPPSSSLRLQIVETIGDVPAKRYARFGSIELIDGVNFVSVDGCPREISDAEAEKLDA